MKKRTQSSVKELRMKTVFLSFFLINSVFCADNQNNAQEQQESLKDKVEVVVIMVKDTVTDTTDTVKRSMNAGTAATKDFIAATTARIKIAFQEARAKQAEQKTREAQKE